MSNDTWRTPNWLMPLFGKLVDRTPPDYTVDALTSDWLEDSYMNPPYSDPLPFVQKALAERAKHGIKVVLLMKCDPSTRWYRALVEGGGHFLFFAERLHYSESKASPNFPSVLIILD